MSYRMILTTKRSVKLAECWTLDIWISSVWNKTLAEVILFWFQCVVHTVIGLQWRHNERDDVSNHRCLVCSIVFITHISQNTSKLHVTGLCEENLPVTGGFPSQRASNGQCFHLMTSSWHYCLWNVFSWQFHTWNVWFKTRDEGRMSNDLLTSCLMSLKYINSRPSIFRFINPTAYTNIEKHEVDIDLLCSLFR